MKIRVVPFAPHSLCFGGFEVQMLSAMNAARTVGANVSPLDFWSLDQDFDTLHIWGFDHIHSELVAWAAKRRKQVVLSALLPYPSLYAATRYRISSLIGPAKFRRQILKNLSVLTVVNEQQAKYAETILSFPKDKIRVIPNIVDNIFFEQAKLHETFQSSEKNRVICTGSICSRKNQLNLVLACKHIDIPVLLVGGVLPGEEEYAARVKKELDNYPAGSWIEHLTPNSSELVATYKSSSIFALPSLEETQPISVLEAASTNLPILLADRPYAHQKIYESAMLVNPKSINSISNGLLSILAYPGKYIIDSSLLETCRQATVGQQYVDAYKLSQNQV